jgi:hypothetical protein
MVTRNVSSGGGTNTGAVSNSGEKSFDFHRWSDHRPTTTASNCRALPTAKPPFCFEQHLQRRIMFRLVPQAPGKLMEIGQRQAAEVFKTGRICAEETTGNRAIPVSLACHTP